MRKEIENRDLKKFLEIVSFSVKRLRGAMGKDQEELARLAGVSRSTIQAIEKGNTISILNLFKIAMALKVHPARLLTEEMSDDGFRENMRTVVKDVLSEILAAGIGKSSNASFDPRASGKKWN